MAGKAWLTIICVATMCAIGLAACSGDGSPNNTDATATDPAQPTASVTSTPTSDNTADLSAEFASFVQEFEIALAEEDAAWFNSRRGHFFNCALECEFVGQDDDVATAVHWLGQEDIMANADDLDVILDEIFQSVATGTEDQFGDATLRIHAVSEVQELPGDVPFSILLVTGILAGPEPGRWGIVFTIRLDDFSQPPLLGFTDILFVPPDRASDLLALGPIPFAGVAEAEYPDGFAGFVRGLEQALQDSDAAFFTDSLSLSSFTCTSQDGGILAVPSCGNASEGTIVNVVPWREHCFAVHCDVGGLALADEVREFIDGLLTSTPDFDADSFGPPQVQLQAISALVTEPGFLVTLTGIGDPILFGQERTGGRWIVTLQVQPVDEDWQITGLTVADPAMTPSVLTRLQGLSVAWTPWP